MNFSKFFNKKQKYFIRGRKTKNSKLQYVGYATREGCYSSILSASWLLRFGGYKEVRIYNSQNKKLNRVWTIKELDDYCERKGINNFVWKDSQYLIIRKQLEY